MQVWLLLHSFYIKLSEHLRGLQWEGILDTTSSKGSPQNFSNLKASMVTVKFSQPACRNNLCFHIRSPLSSLLLLALSKQLGKEHALMAAIFDTLFCYYNYILVFCFKKSEYIPHIFANCISQIDILIIFKQPDFSNNYLLGYHSAHPLIVACIGGFLQTSQYVLQCPE